MAGQRVENTGSCFRGEDIMETLVGTVDPGGWRWLLVAVRDEQAERCSENSSTTD